MSAKNNSVLKNSQKKIKKKNNAPGQNPAEQKFKNQSPPQSNGQKQARAKIPGPTDKQPEKKKPDFGKADLGNWEEDGKPIEVRTWQPRSRRDKPKLVDRQEAEIEHYSEKIEDEVFDEGTTARRAFGNTAPALPPDEVAEWADDVKASSSVPMAVYNAFYRTGGVTKTIEEAKELHEQYRDVDRVGPIRSEEEVAAIRAQYRVPKGGILELPEWDPKMFPPDGTMVLFGRRRSGKSWLVRWIFHLYRHIYRTVIVLTNTKQNAFWGNHVPFRYIHKYDPFVIQKIMEEQKSVLASNILNAENPELIQNPYIAVILDDVVAHDMHHDPMLNELFYEGRHSNMAIFITTQHPKALPPGVRSNADVAVIFPQISEQDEETIMKGYCNFFDDKADFSLALTQYTQNHSSMVVFLGDPEALPIQRLYWYRSDDPGPFFCGALEYWEGDQEARMAYYKQLAEFNKQSSDVGAPQSAAAPPGWQWLSSDTDISGLVSAMTF